MSSSDTPERPDTTNPPQELIAQLERDAGMGVETVESPSTEEHDRPWLLDQTIGHTALEKLCIAIIRAHPTQDRMSTTTDRHRLRSAIENLTGVSPAEGSKALDDRQLLLSMAEDLLRDPELVAGRRRLTELAGDRLVSNRLAASVICRFALRDSPALRLRLSRKFHVGWEAYVGAVCNASYVAHSIEARELQVIAESLQRLGISADVPKGAGAFWPLASDI
ncbi:MAG: hypothetical protein ACK57S_01220 [Brevundimonas sp.]|jgi:hypothetical protein|uniref:hypothetical protein n=1 Tax=Brevundimonas sp. TaxID=1871086 RepID=UPI00391F7587